MNDFDSAPTAPAPSAQYPLEYTLAPLYNARGWIKITGVMSIIYGGVMACTVVGLVVAWLPIWVGVMLVRSVRELDQHALSGDPAQLQQSLEQIRQFFMIQGLMALSGILFMVMALLVILSTGSVLLNLFGM